MAIFLTMGGAWTQGHYVSPPHAVAQRGPSATWETFSSSSTRTQQVDHYLVGSPMVVIRSISFRRRITAMNGSTARKVDLTVFFGYPAASITVDFDKNYAAGTRKSVFSKKALSLPDWTKHVSDPEPFDLIVKLDAPYIYNNRSALLWDLVVGTNTGTGLYQMDYFNSLPAITYGESPQVLGRGCRSSNRVFKHDMTAMADSDDLILMFRAIKAPGSAGTIAILGTRDLNLNIGMCSNLHGDLTILVPIGTTDPSGSLTKYLTFPWRDAFIGVPVVTQLLALDPRQPGLPVSLSNGIRTTTPFINGTGNSPTGKVWRITRPGATSLSKVTMTCVTVRYSL
ncbi:MAG: hypothetical protein R3F30_06530 [Planctomycetota bacterium]